jgi:hypothetical protein
MRERKQEEQKRALRSLAEHRCADGPQPHQQINVERQIDATRFETVVLMKSADGSWEIRYSQTCSRPARRPPA